MVEETKEKIKQMLMDADQTAARRATREWVFRLASSLIVLAAFVCGGLYQQALSGSGQPHYTANNASIDVSSGSK